MNILYLIFHGLSPISGVSKKILNQIDGFKANGHQVALCHYEIREDGHRIRMVDDYLLEDYGNGKLAPLKKRTCYAAVLRYATAHHIKAVYVRSFHNANPFTIRLFHKLRKAGIKVVMEIPTFPYDQEYRHLPLTWKAELLVDQCFRRQLACACYRIVTFSDADIIFGQKTIRISNGINFNVLPLRKRPVPPPDGFRLIAVAEIHYWHGYDRIIEGLGLYYQTHPARTVFLDLIGGTGAAETAFFTSLIQKYHLEPYITLHGQMQGKELDALFDQADFAIGSLGRHRSGIEKIKTLKNREYAARGIPFIYSETDEDFEQMPYILKATADNTPISIEKILNFHDRLTLSPEEIRHSIRHLAWDQQMQKVIEALSRPK